MKCFIQILIFTIPALGMIAGLASSSLITLFLIILLIYLKNKLTFSVQNLKLELTFMAWCFLSCVWSINSIYSFLMYLQVFLVILIGLVVRNNIHKLDFDTIQIERPLIFGVLAAVGLFFIEYFSYGFLSGLFRKMFQPSSTKSFQLYDLDRGCALFTLASWLVIGFLLSHKKYYSSFLFYIFVFFMLSISDSLASFLAFSISGMFFIISKLINLRFVKFVSLALILGSILMPIFAYKIEPRAISNKYHKYTPDSAKHRLFIWHFVANKITEKPILGFGFGSSKNIKVNDDEMIEYNGYKWSPLPLHPHNNVMQILLETGLIGFLLFLALIYKFCKEIILIDQKNLNFELITFTCFVNYYIIGMISFGIWQLWWVCAGIWSSVMIQCLRNNDDYLTRSTMLSNKNLNK